MHALFQWLACVLTSSVYISTTKCCTYEPNWMVYTDSILYTLPCTQVCDEAHFLFNAYTFVWSDHSNTACSWPAASWPCVRRHIPPPIWYYLWWSRRNNFVLCFWAFHHFHVDSEWQDQATYIMSSLGIQLQLNLGWVKIVCKSKSGCTCKHVLPLLIVLYISACSVWMLN